MAVDPYDGIQRGMRSERPSFEGAYLGRAHTAAAAASTAAIVDSAPARSPDRPAGLRSRRLSLTLASGPTAAAEQGGTVLVSPTSSSFNRTPAPVGHAIISSSSGEGTSDRENGTDKAARPGEDMRWNFRGHTDESALAAASRRAMNRIALPNGGDHLAAGPYPRDSGSRPSSLYATPPEMSRESSSSGPVAPASLRYGTAASAPRTHQAYTLGAPSPSASARSSISSLLPRSPSQTSFASMSSSSPPSMERSRSAESHLRNQSLTSACAPVTIGAPGAGVVRGSDPDPFSPESRADSRAGLARTYDWTGETEKVYSSDEDVRQGAKRRASAQTGLVARVLDAPPNLLSRLTRPLRAKPPSRSLATTVLNGSTFKGANATAPRRRSPLIIRLALISYLALSLLYLTCSLPRLLLGAEPALSTDKDGTFAALRARIARTGGGDPGESWRDLAGDLGAKAGVAVPRPTGADAMAQATTADAPEEPEVANDSWGKVQRIGNPDEPPTATRDPHKNPLTPFTHTYRLSKMHDKVHWDLFDEIIPYAFHATAKISSDDATALLYSNDAWLDTLPTFVKAWRGPVSLVFETVHSRHDTERRSALLDAISALRDAHPLVKQFVDFHVLGVPKTMSARSLAKARERMIRQPFARNFHLNLARFFAQTDIIFLVGDARITPSGGLRRRLTEPAARSIMLDHGDALVVPTFGFIRDTLGEPSKIATTAQLREQLGFSEPDEAHGGVSADEFDAFAAQHIRELYESLPISPEDWPSRKQALVQLVNTRSPTTSVSTTAELALFDRRWEPNRGPSNWYLWRKSAADPRLEDEPAAGGGLGIGVDGKVGGGREPYRVVDYDLHYAPLVATSRKGHPWCTERFDDLRAACTYQMFLAGAEMYVLPEDWVYTLEVLEKSPAGYREDPAEKLKNSISSRLYGKFHQEACMHYGREFLSVGMWDSDKAQHLRETCARTLGTWGMGSA
ncbi:hypothetical protein JCM3774_002858 [Rhodotorula dairenensis]